jgi:cell division protein ZapB
MASNDPRMDNQDLKILESRIDDLIETCRRLKNENQTLKSGQNTLNEQHTRLVEKTRVARARIETMIDRLKALERS